MARLSYTQDKDGELQIIEENHYYPYGLKHQNYNVDTLDYVEGENGYVLASESALQYKFKFNGQEWQEELGLNTTAMDFRDIDNAIGRFWGMDPLAEYEYSKTPNHFGANNPVIYSDPSGLKQDFFGHNYWFDTDGRRKRDRMGLYIPAYQRGDGMSDGGFDSGYLGAQLAYSGLGGSGGGGGDSISSKIISSGSGGVWIRHSWVETSTIPNDDGSLDTVVFNRMHSYEFINRSEDGTSEAGTVLGIYSTSLEHMSKINAAKVYSYGTKAVSASELGRLNYVRMMRIASRAKVGGHLLSVAQIGYGIHQDGGQFGYNAQVATGGAVGGYAGAWAGAQVGMMWGAALGPGGVLLGGMVGAIIGGYIGSEIGSRTVQSLY